MYYEETSWQNWSVSRANLLSKLRNDPREGEEFITWVWDNLSLDDGGRETKQLLGEYYVGQAYFAHENGRYNQISTNVFQALRYDKRCLLNKGLWAFTLKSLRSG